MKILFENSATVGIDLIDSPLKNVYTTIYKNLQHTSIPFQPWDNPIFYERLTFEKTVDHLVEYAAVLGINVDRSRALIRDQQYFNDLHLIYEKQYNGDDAWLKFHECIHVCEVKGLPARSFNFDHFAIDYREKAGMLERKFDPEWIKYGQTTIKIGDVFTVWSELGKTPYGYWRTREPNNIDRMCELAKPWVILKPKLLIATQDIDYLKDKDTVGFNSWWKIYGPEWCQHWGLDQWTVEQQNSVIRIGQVTDIPLLLDLVNKEIAPVRVTLD